MYGETPKTYTVKCDVEGCRDGWMPDHTLCQNCIGGKTLIHERPARWPRRVAYALAIAAAIFFLYAMAHHN